MKRYFYITILFVLLSFGARAQTAAERTFVGGGLLWQQNLLARIDLRYFIVDKSDISIATGIAGNFGYASKRIIAIPEVHFDFYSHKMQIFDYLIPFIRVSSSPWYIAPEAGVGLVFIDLSMGYAFPYRKPSGEIPPYQNGGFRVNLSISLPLEFKLKW